MSAYIKEEFSVPPMPSNMVEIYCITVLPPLKICTTASLTISTGVNTIFRVSVAQKALNRY